MYKGVIDLGMVGTMCVKFNLIIKDEQVSMFTKMNEKKHSQKLVDTYRYKGTDYFKISPKPYIYLDISKTARDRGEEWNSDMGISVNRISLFHLVTKIKRMLDGFATEGLFFMKSEKLYVNTDIADTKSETVKCANGSIIMKYAVITDRENEETEYEGICFFINKIESFCTFSYDEFAYFHHLLNGIDMNALSVTLINAFILNQIRSIEHTAPVLKELHIERPVAEKPPIEEDMSSTLPKIELPSTLPDI